MAEWRFADARWLDLMRAHKISAVHRIVLRFDESHHRVWAAESEAATDFSAGFDGAALKWEMNWGITFYEFKKETVYGFQLKDGKLVRDATYSYRFNLSELRQPLIAAVTTAGWDYYPDLRFSTLFRSLWHKTSKSAPSAQPPLDYRLNAATAIVRCLTEVGGNGVKYRIDETLKGKLPPSFAHDGYLVINTGMFEQLGYRPQTGREVIVLVMDQPIELLPVNQGRIVYAPADHAVRKELSIDQLRRLLGR